MGERRPQSFTSRRPSFHITQKGQAHSGSCGSSQWECRPGQTRVGNCEQSFVRELLSALVTCSSFSRKHQEVIHSILDEVFLLHQLVTCFLHFSNHHIAADSMIG